MMALCQGHLLSSEPVRHLYNGTMGDAQLQWECGRLSIPASGPLHPSTVLTSVEKSQRESTSLDLRQAIMQLQYLCQQRVDGSSGGVEQVVWLEDTIVDVQEPEPIFEDYNVAFKEEIAISERRSYVDAILSRPFDRACEVRENMPNMR